MNKFLFLPLRFILKKISTSKRTMNGTFMINKFPVG